MARSTTYQAPFAPGGTHAVDQELASRLLTLALAAGGDYADLFFEYSAAASYSFEEGLLRAASRSTSIGLGVRVLKGEATGYAYVQELTEEAMRRAATTAARIASDGAKVDAVPVATRALPSRYDLDRLSLDDPGPIKRELLERASARALSFDPRIIRAEAGLVEGVKEVLIATSDGRFAFDVRPMLRFTFRAIAEDGGRRESGSSGGGGRVSLGYFEGKSPELHAERACRQALTMLDAREAPAGELPLVLAPGDSGVLLHEAVGHGLEADFNRKGSSSYAGRMGEMVASPLCNVVDDASLLQGRGSLNVDDEGQLPERATLIEDGRLVGYLHDRISARHYGIAPTGNGRRESFSCTPLPRMTNTILLAGEDDPEDIVRSVKKGIFAKAFGGGQVDIGPGDFVFNLTEGYLIEDGKITAPLKGVNLIGNGPDVLSRVSMLGHDVEVSDGIWTCGKAGQSVPVGVGCPTIKVDRITVGGTRVG